MIKLAVFGDEPNFTQALHVGRPNIGNRENLMQRFNNILDSRRFTNNGPYVEELEEKLCKMLGVKNCIAVCNGTISLELATRALDVKGEVIMPSATFVATAHALQWQEITPVFCDIDPETHNIDPDKIERLITPRTSGILAVHLFGKPCNIEKLQAIADKHKLKLIFDSAHALGCSYNGKMIGNFGDVESFSFHATKFVNTFEGGALTTNNNELAKKLRLMRNFGFSGFDNVIYIGTNGKMSEISAAMGLTSFESIDEFIGRNKENYDEYRKGLEGVKGVKLIEYNDKEKNNYQYITVEVDKEKTGISRDELVDIFHAENVVVRKYFYPGCHRMEPYRSYYPNAGLLLGNTERFLEEVVSFPTGCAVEKKDINTICALIREIVSNGKEISEKLKTLARKGEVKKYAAPEEFFDAE